MTEKRCLKSKFSIMKVFGILFLLLMSTITVQAATNPLAKMPTKDGKVLHKVGGSYGDDFLTPEYSSKVTISAKSSNPKVARVEANAYKYEKNYYAGYKTTPLSPGTTKIKVSVTVNKKTYTKVCTYTVYKWENPFKSIKIGVLDCKPLLQKSGAVGLKRKILNGKFTYKMNSDFVLINAYAYYYPNLKNIYGGKSVSLKNGQILPKNTTEISLRAKSKKNKQEYRIRIMALNNNR